MVMKSRKAAPALRARLLRSYVPLRRDPSESVLSGTIPGLPGGFFSTHKFKFTEKTLCFLQLLLYKIIIKKTFMGTLDIIYTEVKPG